MRAYLGRPQRQKVTLVTRVNDLHVIYRASYILCERTLHSNLFTDSCRLCVRQQSVVLAPHHYVARLRIPVYVLLRSTTIMYLVQVFSSRKCKGRLGFGYPNGLWTSGQIDNRCTAIKINTAVRKPYRTQLVTTINISEYCSLLFACSRRTTMDYVRTKNTWYLFAVVAHTWHSYVRVGGVLRYSYL